MSLCMRPVHTEHCARVLNWALSHLFSVCKFKLRFVSIRSGAGGSEGELGSVLLSVNMASECSVELFHILCLNALISFECLNWQGLKTRANDKLW